MFRQLRALVALLLISSTALSSAVLAFPLALLLFVLPGCDAAHRWFTSHVTGTWLSFVSAVLEGVYGIRYQLSGGGLDSEGASLVISNHRTRLDWALLWPAFARFGGGLLSKLFIVLKADLKSLPVLGWHISMARYLFLSRRWELDEQHLTDMLAYISSANKGHFSVLLYPEGTDLQAVSRARSDAFAAKHGLPIYQHILHPRTTGTVHAIQQLRQLTGGDQTVVHDVTVGYRGPIPQTEKSLFGAMCTGVDVVTRSLRVADLPASDDGLSDWIAARWKEKEAALTKYYAGEDLRLPPIPGELPAVEPSSPFPTYTFAVVWQTLLLYAAATLVRAAPLVAATWLALQAAFFLFIAPRLGGMDHVELRYKGRKHLKKRQ